MKIDLPPYILFFLLIALGFLMRGTYHFFIITLDGGITLIESNFYIALVELSLIFSTFMILSVYTIKVILVGSQSFIKHLTNPK